ncbi:hypothetical protein M5K25_016868 [Dendrobium thyrsiflorum]|uniref:DUF4283 domain-containing protein n=1 Tax=Dendrobium thyrsiflorum TaxID=117978 RepID=A0ABD0USX1_DENTH
MTVVSFNGRKNICSFLEALSRASSLGDFSNLKLSTHRELPSLWISEVEILDLAQPFEYALVGSLFGRPLKTNNAAAVGLWSSVVRVLVELDVSKSYPESVWICPDNLGYIQQIAMENFPPFCDHCKSLGHYKPNCGILHPHVVRAPPIVSKPIVQIVGIGSVAQRVFVDVNAQEVIEIHNSMANDPLMTPIFVANPVIDIVENGNAFQEGIVTHNPLATNPLLTPDIDPFWFLCGLPADGFVGLDRDEPTTAVVVSDTNPTMDVRHCEVNRSNDVDVNDEVSIIDVPISLVDNDDIGADQGDWLAECDLLANCDVEEEIYVNGDDSLGIYGLNVIRNVEEGCCGYFYWLEQIATVLLLLHFFCGPALRWLLVNA